MEKMSKSLGNYIGLYEDADAMFGKCMQIPDALIERYFTLCTDLTPDAIAVYRPAGGGREPRRQAGPGGDHHRPVPRGRAAARAARERFIQVFTQGELPGGHARGAGIRSGVPAPADPAEGWAPP